MICWKLNQEKLNFKKLKMVIITIKIISEGVVIVMQGAPLT